MKKQNQLSFTPGQPKFFGGALLQGKRKSQRPLSSKDAIHLVLRSEHAIRQDSFLARRNKRAIEQTLKHFAKKFGVRIYRTAVNGNHIHLLIWITNRTLYKAFIRAVSGKIACHVMGGQNFKSFCISRRGHGSPSTKSKGFWQHRPFSRIVSWGRDFKNCARYIQQNIFEALGFVNYKPRKENYSKWLIHILPNRLINSC